MKPNKSIDGLVTRDSKKSQKSTMPLNSTKKTTKKSANKPAKKSKPIKVVATEEPLITNTPDETKEIILDESLEITSPKEQISEQTVDDFLSPVQAFNPDEEPEKTPMESKKSDKKEKKSKKENKIKKEKKKPSKARRIITAIALVIVLGLIGLVLWVMLWGNDIIAKITGGQGNVFDLISLANDTYESLKTDANGRTNILAFGTSGYNMQGDEGNGVHDGAGSICHLFAILRKTVEVVHI